MSNLPPKWIIKDGKQEMGEIAYVMRKYYQATLFVTQPAGGLIRLGHFSSFEEADNKLREAYRLMRAIDYSRAYFALQENERARKH